MNMINDMELDNSLGPTGKDITVNGIRGNRMVKCGLLCQMAP